MQSAYSEHVLSSSEKECYATTVAAEGTVDYHSKQHYYYYKVGNP